MINFSLCGFFEEYIRRSVEYLETVSSVRVSTAFTFAFCAWFAVNVAWTSLTATGQFAGGGRGVSAAASFSFVAGVT